MDYTFSFSLQIYKFYVVSYYICLSPRIIVTVYQLPYIAW